MCQRRDAPRPDGRRALPLSPSRPGSESPYKQDDLCTISNVEMSDEGSVEKSAACAAPRSPQVGVRRLVAHQRPGLGAGQALAAADLGRVPPAEVGDVVGVARLDPEPPG